MHKESLDDILHGSEPRTGFEADLPILSVANATKQFGGLVAIYDLTFDVEASEVIGLMGPNGAGKTTLINLIAGVYRLDSGRISFKGHNIAGLPPHKICRLGIARTYQIPQPFSSLTALQNVMVAAMYARGLEEAAAENQAVKLLELVDLSEKKNMLARNLDEVTRKRLELARALATDPALLLIDEVAAGLTEAEIPRVLDIVLEIRKVGITVILIEHVMRVMLEAVDRIIVIESGRKISEGTPKEVMEDRRVIATYLGEAE
jgi:branched-chain amino acid transport system ATP-binding protein